MKKIIFFASVLMYSFSLSSCDDYNLDKEKSVEITIYPETVVKQEFLSDIWSDYLVYSDNEGDEKYVKSQIIFEDLDFEYQRGYEYKFKAKKIWMSNPPMDVANVKYKILKPISKTKVITEQSEEVLEISIKPNLVEYVPSYPVSYEEDGERLALDVMLAFQSDTKEFLAITNIEGFEYEEGYEYVLDVKKTTNPDPYSVKYELVELKSKEEAIAK